MEDKKTKGYINRYILGWATKILIAFFVVVILIFVFFRWTGAITKTPFNWKRPTINLVDNKSSEPITQRTNQLWINAKFKKHHANVKTADIYLINEKGDKEGSEKTLVKGSNTYIFNGVSSGTKKVYSHITWSLYGDETYYLGEAKMNDVTSMSIKESSIKNDFDGTSFTMDTINENNLYTMNDMKESLPSKYYYLVISYLNNYLFQPWLGENYSDLISGEYKDEWINMPLAFNMLVNDEHELTQIVDSYNSGDIKSLKEIKNLPNKLFQSFIPQPFILDNDEGMTSEKNLAIHEGSHNYKFNEVLTNDHEFVTLKYYSNKETNFKIMPIGLAYKKGEDGKKSPYIVTPGNIIKPYALGTPEFLLHDTWTPIFFQTFANDDLSVWFNIKMNKFHFIDDSDLELTLQQIDNGDHKEFKKHERLSKINSYDMGEGRTSYHYSVDYDYLKDTEYFNTIGDDGKPLDSIKLKGHIKITYQIPDQKEYGVMETDLYQEFWIAGTPRPKDTLEIESVSKDSPVKGELNTLEYKDYGFDHPEWIQFESNSDIPPTVDCIEINWKQAYWTKVPTDDIKIQFKFIPFRNEGFESNWFSFVDHNGKIPPEDIASTSGKPVDMEPWKYHFDDKVFQYNEDGTKVSDTPEMVYEYLKNPDGTDWDKTDEDKGFDYAKMLLFYGRSQFLIRIIGQPSVTNFWDDGIVHSEGIEDETYVLNGGEGFWVYDYTPDNDENNRGN